MWSICSSFIIILHIYTVSIFRHSYHSIIHQPCMYIYTSVCKCNFIPTGIAHLFIFCMYSNSLCIGIICILASALLMSSFWNSIQLKFTSISECVYIYMYVRTWDRVYYPQLLALVYNRQYNYQTAQYCCLWLFIYVYAVI